ncbi:hypothetical protein A8F94_09650 [Bacillus sp. FJAT-27225]|uniref:TRAFAC clade GTPase domain-containing protein n=1 Tax=Bacillus sp. FJAT-27225 TaxID=1743144 RepID=UPI00080C309B|nr:hypothetical protein [Bacillus sp. FJAT-27225]OCA88073.1 hypothetical protein A8F94_09650 [Bacillus sp. FJAT-27225]
MIGKLKELFGGKKAVKERPAYYDIVCPYCFSKFHPEKVVFRAAHHRTDDEAYMLQEDELLSDYREKFQLDRTGDMEAVINPATIPQENKIYTDNVLTGISDKYSVVTRKRLCPNCHNNLPSTAGKFPSNIVSFVGATSVGKSVYLASLIHTIQNTTARNFNAACIPLDNKISERFRNNYELPLFEEGELLTSTRSTQRQEPLIFQFKFKDDTKAPLTLVFFDVAGEAMTDTDYMELHAAHIKNSAGILFLVDPMQIRSIRSRLLFKMGENPGEVVAQGADPRDVAISLYENFISHEDNGKTGIPTAVVLTKSDLLHALKEEDGDYIRPNSNVFRNVVHRDFLNLDEYENINGEVRRFLEEVDSPFVDTMDVYFNEASYFAVSALGSNPIDQQVTGVINPIRVDEPFVWLLHKLGYIEGGRSQ